MVMFIMIPYLAHQEYSSRDSVRPSWVLRNSLHETKVACPRGNDDHDCKRIVRPQTAKQPSKATMYLVEVLLALTVYVPVEMIPYSG